MNGSAQAPTERLARLVRAGTPWTALEHHGEVTSTNDLAAARAREGAAPGLVVVADHQTAGRGRSGRRWEDRPGGSLLVSCLVAPPGGPLPLVPVVAGLAVSDAARRAGGTATVKWPNDVLVGGRKCAGVLVEHHGAAAGQPARLVVGVGLNVDWRGTEVPPGWTSLAGETGRDQDRFAILADLLDALADRLGQVEADPGGLLRAYRRRCATLGWHVEVGTPGGTVRGRATDIDRQGALLVDTGQGTVAVSTGEVLRTRPANGDGPA